MKSTTNLTDQVSMVQSKKFYVSSFFLFAQVVNYEKYVLNSVTIDLLTRKHSTMKKNFVIHTQVLFVITAVGLICFMLSMFHSNPLELN